MKYTLTEIEIELKKRLAYRYKWGMKQNDDYDRQTNFIYHTFSFENLLLEIQNRFKEKNSNNNIANYTLNRWYNFWSAQAIEKIFCSLPSVKPALDEKDKLVDFTIQGVTFDHKTSVFPQNYPQELTTAYSKSDELIRWLYKNQSQQQRKHLKNRLFIVLYSNSGEHWKLKAEITWLKKIIQNYLIGFNPAFLFRFSFEKDYETLSDIIWAIKK